MVDVFATAQTGRGAVEVVVLRCTRSPEDGSQDLRLELRFPDGQAVTGFANACDNGAVDFSGALLTAMGRRGIQASEVEPVVARLVERRGPVASQVAQGGIVPADLVLESLRERSRLP